MVDPDWTLTPEQMKWMDDNADDVTYAFDNEYFDVVRALADSDDFKALFGEMTFDEAYDRYTTPDVEE